MLDLEQVYRYIDNHVGEDVAKLQELLRQSSSSKTDPEGTRRCASLVRKYLTDLGCRNVEMYDPGMRTYIGEPGYPVVYGEYEARAKKTLLVYLVYDTQPSDSSGWMSPPLEADLQGIHPLGECMVARGAVNQKGPLRAFLNAIEAIKATGQEPPVNLKFVADGEREELMSPTLTQFITERRKSLNVDAVLYPDCSQGPSGRVQLELGYKGTYGFVLECKGGDWGGPTRSDISPTSQPWVDNPAWRLVQALSTLYDAKNHRVLVHGWYDNIKPPDAEDTALIDKLMESFDERAIRESLGVRRFANDAHGKELLTQYLYGSELTIYHMHAGTATPSSLVITGLLPWKATARINARLLPDQNAEQVVPMIRTHLDAHGFPDIEIVGPVGYPWSKVSLNEPFVQATIGTFRKFGYEPVVWPHSPGSAPHYLFTNAEYMNVPCLAAGLGHGGNAHARNEYIVIEGEGSIQGLATYEKFFVALLNEFATGNTE